MGQDLMLIFACYTRDGNIGIHEILVNGGYKSLISTKHFTVLLFLIHSRPLLLHINPMFVI